MGLEERYTAIANHHRDAVLQMETTESNHRTVGPEVTAGVDKPRPPQFVITEDNSGSLPICRICHCTREDLIIESGQSQPAHSKNGNRPNKTKQKKPKSAVPGSFGHNNDGDPFVLITPCYCTGTLRYVHHKCLQQWIRSSNHKYCELCKYNFKLKTKNKPLYKWQCFSMSGGERRKLIFHFSFNLVSMICVFWSIYVIAERASAEITGRLGWRFWIKMLVVTVGFVCGIMFVFFQLKLYFSIFARWKQFNQMIVIENVRKENLLLTHQTGKPPQRQLSILINGGDGPDDSEAQRK